MTQPLLVIKELCKQFGELKVTDGLSLTIAAKELHALIGPNGAGKTTLMRELSGQVVPDGGQILFKGQDITRSAVCKRIHYGIGRSFQIAQIFENLTVQENLTLAVQAHMGHSFRFWQNASSDPALCAAVEAAMQDCGLEERAREKAATLSHGEKRQLDMGLALAGKPEILLMDEPMAGMGPGGTVKMTQLISQLKGNVTILLVEHDMDVIFALADRITVLVSGRVIASGTPSEIRNNELVQQAYLGDKPGDKPHDKVDSLC